MNQQPVHMDVLFIMIQGLIDQSNDGHIARLQFAKEAQPVFKDIVRQISEQHIALKREAADIRNTLKTENMIIRSLRHLLSEHLDFIDHMDLREEYNDFCLAQLRKENGK